MIKKIISTTATRLIAAAISFIIVILNSRNIGAAGVGTIGIIILDITIITNISGFFGGPSFVYFTPRKKIKNLFITSLFSAFAGPLIFLLFYYVAGSIFNFADVLAPETYVFHIVMISFLLVFHSNNMSVILGRQRIYAHNLITVIQQVVLITVLLFLFFVNGDFTVLAYLKAYYAALIAAAVPGLVLVLKEMYNDNKTGKLNGRFFKEILSFGFTVQMASLFQVFNYRMPYYFLKFFFPAGNRLGIFTVGTQLAEGLWIVGKSISMVQYSSISNTTDRKKNSELTINLLKFSVVTVSFLLIILLFLPVDFYVFLFGGEVFGEVKTVILYLSPGIIALTANMIISHFLSGTGKPVYNMMVSFTGLVIITISGYYLVKHMGLAGAAIAASITYISTMIMSFYFYFKNSDSGVYDLFIDKKDFMFFKEMLIRLFKGNKN